MYDPSSPLQFSFHDPTIYVFLFVIINGTRVGGRIKFIMTEKFIYSYLPF
jgi:prolipoprotein diacylglyceryltransferase